MTRWFALAAVVLAAGCDVCPAQTIETEKFASVAQFHDDIVACTNRHDCDQLCLDVFQLGVNDSLESCVITKLVPAGGQVRVRYSEAQVCGGDDGDVVIDVGDDGTDCTDGSCDPPPDDPCSDGSCDPPPDPDPDPPPDDGSTDDGTSLRKQITPLAPVIRPAS